MEVYEDRVKALRNNADHYMTVDGAAGLVHLLTDAADAIEELRREKAKIENSGKLLAAAFERLKEKANRWIPSEEKKPPLPEGEDFCYVNVIAAIKGRKESEQVRYCRANRFRDGKLERIERFVGDGEVLKVTHWMPMPELPELHKEEKA